jgi:WD40 repeat protein
MKAFSFLVFLFPVVLSAQEPRLMIASGHEGSIAHMALSNDSKRILTASEADRTVCLWDAERSILLLKFPVTCSEIGFSPDGKLFYILNDSLSIYDAAGNLRFVLAPDEHGFETAAFSPDSKRLITSGWFYSRYWDATTGKLLADWGGKVSSFGSKGIFSADKILYAHVTGGALEVHHTITGKRILSIEGQDVHMNHMRFSADNHYILIEGNKIFSIEKNDFVSTFYDEKNFWSGGFSPSGKYVAGTSRFDDSSVVIYDMNYSMTSFELKDLRFPVDSVLFSMDEKTIYLVSENEIAAWSLEEKKQLFTITEGDGSFEKIFDRNNEYVFLWSGSVDKGKIYDLKTGKLHKELTGHIGYITAAATDAEGNKIITGDYSGKVMISTIRDAKTLAVMDKKTRGIFSTAFSPDHRYFIPLTFSNALPVTEFKTGRVVNEFTSEYIFADAVYSKDGKWLLARTFNGIASLWDLSTGKKLIETGREGHEVRDVVFDAKATGLIMQYDHEIELWNILKMKKERSYRINTGNILYTEFSGDGNYFLTQNKDTNGFYRISTLYVWDGRTGKLLYSKKGHKDLGVAQAKLGPTGKTVSYATNDVLEVIEIRSGKKLYQVKNKDAFMGGFMYSPDGTKILTSGVWSPLLKLLDAATGKLLFTFKGHAAEIQNAEFSMDGKMVYSVGKDRKMKAWEVRTGKLVTTIDGKHRDIVRVHISADKKNAILTSADHSLSVWDIPSKKNLYDVYGLTYKSILYRNPSQFYFCPPDAARHLYYVTPDLKVITFEQLDIKYNRPDKVLQSMGSPDTSLIASYAQAWQKRIKKLGVDTSAFEKSLGLPSAEIFDRENIPVEQKHQNIMLNISAADADFNLDRFNLWLNDVPMFGQRGIRLRERNTRKFDTLLLADLIPGKNVIEVSVFNTNGIESYREPLQVTYTPENHIDSSLHFIGLGIDRFMEPGHSLNYSVKDIRDLAAALKEKYKGKIIIDTLFNEALTIENVAALRKKLLKGSINDKVIISYSGHGLLNKEYDYFLSTYDVSFKSPEVRGLAYDELEKLIDSIPARKKLVLIDACHSGEIDKEEMANYRIVLDNPENTVLKGGEVYNTDTSNKRMGMKNSFELMQQLFANVSKSTGATVISAAAGTELAQEQGLLKNGVFTYALLEFMRQKETATVSDLKNFLKKRVTELTKGLQSPTTRSESISVDWNVW